MIPNLPLIEDIKFIEKDFSSNDERFTTLLSNFFDKNVILTSKLGIK